MEKSGAVVDTLPGRHDNASVSSDILLLSPIKQNVKYGIRVCATKDVGLYRQSTALSKTAMEMS